MKKLITTAVIALTTTSAFSSTIKQYGAVFFNNKTDQDIIVYDTGDSFQLSDFRYGIQNQDEPLLLYNRDAAKYEGQQLPNGDMVIHPGQKFTLWAIFSHEYHAGSIETNFRLANTETDNNEISRKVALIFADTWNTDNIKGERERRARDTLGSYSEIAHHTEYNSTHNHSDISVFAQGTSSSGLQFTGECYSTDPQHSGDNDNQKCNIDIEIA